jgi:hypothetical protein
VPLDLHDISADPRDLADAKAVTQQFSKGLLAIFDFYLAKANIRRNHAVSVEKVHRNGCMECGCSTATWERKGKKKDLLLHS